MVKKRYSVKTKESRNKCCNVTVSIITYYEISSGLPAKNGFKQLEIFEDFSRENLVIPLTENSCKISSEFYSILKHKGCKKGKI